MIKVGYVKTDNTDITHKNCSNTMEANDSLFALKESKADDSSISYFYLAQQATETEWQKYAFLDPS